jgi:hypothetical protein
MIKPKFQSVLHELTRISLWYWFSLVLVSGVICVFALRANNEHMVVLRDAVYSADKNNSDVASALQQLQAYVTTHMNTNLSDGNGSVYPPIQLKYTYQRLLNAESAAAAQANASLYTAAQDYCQIAIPNAFSGRTRVPCIEQYVETHDTNLPTIPDALYKFDFVSPSWSPDLAGWSMVVVILSTIAFCLTFIAQKLLPKIRSY